MAVVAVSAWEATASVSESATVRRHGDRTVISLHGDQDITTAPVVADTLARVIAMDDADLVVDLRDVTFLSAAVIRLLVRSRALTDRYHRSMTLRAPSPCAARVLAICGLTDFVEPS